MLLDLCSVSGNAVCRTSMFSLKGRLHLWLELLSCQSVDSLNLRKKSQDDTINNGFSKFTVLEESCIALDVVWGLKRLLVTSRFKRLHSKRLIQSSVNHINIWDDTFLTLVIYRRRVHISFQDLGQTIYQYIIKLIILLYFS